MFMPTKPNDLTGQRFGHLLVEKLDHRTSKRKYYWRCICDCGNVCVVQASKLTTGYTKSCGCLRHNSPPNKTHGLKDDELYPVWCQMRYRCENPNHQAYKWYGAKGVKVCESWHDFKTFYDWMHANNWKRGLTIDRINTNGNYEPDNCRLVSMEIQQNNRNNNIRIECGGELHTISEWSKIIGVGRGTIYHRYFKGKGV